MKNGDRRRLEMRAELPGFAMTVDDGFSENYVDLMRQINWEYCEVLEAYLSDEEVNALVADIQQWRHDQMKPETRLKNVEEVIREHFKRGGER